MDVESVDKSKEIITRVIKGNSKSAVAIGLEINKVLSHPNGPDLEEFIDNREEEFMGQKFKEALEKKMGKKPMGSGGNVEINKGFIGNFSNTNLINFNFIGSKHVDKPKNSPMDDNINQGNLDLKEQANNGDGILEKIKAHYNPVFNKSEGFIVPISDNTLDPELLSPQNLCKNSKAKIDDTSSKSDCNIDSGNQGCANVKFPRIFWEDNMEHKPDIISLLELRVSGPKVDSIIAKLGFQFSHCMKDILGEVVCDWVRKVFEGNPIDPELNNTLVILIPKVQNLESFG
ncbi:hypothetical protein J1N35_035197 [Gossypium stocksii]|uniref:Uncharacterized protein n=1 Tax=Gossypium stocksii TaxID=47602 RepID=A0A9D3UTH0_9ROSI|nr:hypothetical protein J1N35_035197 [Gossypium stocksii]